MPLPKDVRLGRAVGRGAGLHEASVSYAVPAEARQDDAFGKWGQRVAARCVRAAVDSARRGHGVWEEAHERRSLASLEVRLGHGKTRADLVEGKQGVRNLTICART